MEREWENEGNTSPRPHRVTPRLSEQIQVIRELWLLREQARVQAAERCFLADLERILSGHGGDSRRADVLHSSAVASTTSSAASSSSGFRSLPERRTHRQGPLEDGAVYESNPPPRDEHSAPARERPELVLQQVEETRQLERVTNLSPEFRALLEGTAPQLERRAGHVRTRSVGELGDQRAVSNALDSEFRHRLESILVRRDSRHPHQMRHMYHAGSYEATGARNLATREFEDQVMADEDHTMHNGRTSASSPALESAVRALQEEVNILKNVISASFDIQLDIQRSIRQEVSAAMCDPTRLSLQSRDVSECTAEASSAGASSSREGMNSSSAPSGAGRAGVGLPTRNVLPVARGTCCVCLEASIDSLLYGCGHMCTCAMCGRQLISSGQCCPICRAPVRDVVRAFMATE